MNAQPLSFSMLKIMEDKYCIGCGELTQKGSRRIISDSTDILSLWEEALKKIWKRQGPRRCRKCYVKVKKKLEVSSQNFSYLVIFSNFTI